VVLIIIQRIAAFIDHGVDLPSYFVAVRNEWGRHPRSPKTWYHRRRLLRNHPKKKTVTLMLVAPAICEDVVQVENMRNLANSWMAFQIKDDLFDYSGCHWKPTGLTSKNKKWLCLLFMFWIRVLQKKTWLINSINHNKDKKRVKEVIVFVKQHGYMQPKNGSISLVLLDNTDRSLKTLILMVNDG
jgi:octaprenyl-diphosphate synthase